MVDAVLVDYSWLLARAYYALLKQNTSVVVEGKQVYTGDVFRALQDIVGLKRAAPGARIILCVDTKTEGGQYLSAEGQTDYKSGRVKDGKFEKYHEVLALACMLDDVYVAGAYGAEGDEIIVSLARYLMQRDKTVMIFANDKDVCQAIYAEQVLMSKTIKAGHFEDVMDEQGVAERFHGCSPVCLPMYQAMVGDGVDGVKGYPRFHKKIAGELAQRYMSPEALESRAPGELPARLEKQAKKLDAWSDTLKANFKLTDMRGDRWRADQIRIYRPGPRPDLLDTWRLGLFTDVLSTQGDTLAYAEQEL